MRHRLDHPSDALADVSIFYRENGPRSRERFNKVAGLDLTLPELGGRECCDLLRAVRSDLPVLFCSGDDDDAAQLRPGEREITRFLHKPYRRAEVIAQLHALLGSASARAPISPGPARKPSR